MLTVIIVIMCLWLIVVPILLFESRIQIGEAFGSAMVMLAIIIILMIVSACLEGAAC